MTGCDYAYVTEMLTTKLYKGHLLDVTTVNGINYSSEASLRHLLWRHKSQSRTVALIKDCHPDDGYLLSELKQGQDPDEAAITIGKKKGYRSTTIMSDYDTKITVKHAKRQ